MHTNFSKRWRRCLVNSCRHVSDTWKCGSLSFTFTPPPEDLKKRKKEATERRGEEPENPRQGKLFGPVQLHSTPPYFRRPNVKKTVLSYSTRWPFSSFVQEYCSIQYDGWRFSCRQSGWKTLQFVDFCLLTFVCWLLYVDFCPLSSRRRLTAVVSLTTLLIVLYRIWPATRSRYYLDPSYQVVSRKRNTSCQVWWRPPDFLLIELLLLRAEKATWVRS